GNIGGALTPLGDPPLFIGFLKGVDFFWPTRHLLGPMLMCLAVLLPVFYVLDRILIARDGPRPPDDETSRRFGLEGRINIRFLVGVIVAVLASGLWRSGVEFDLHGVHVALEDIVRSAALLVLTLLSFRLTDPATRRANSFHWHPIVEVAKLFAGIFVTIIPVI